MEKHELIRIASSIQPKKVVDYFMAIGDEGMSDEENNIRIELFSERGFSPINELLNISMRDDKKIYKHLREKVIKTRMDENFWVIYELAFNSEEHYHRPDEYQFLGSIYKIPLLKFGRGVFLTAWKCWAAVEVLQKIDDPHKFMKYITNTRVGGNYILSVDDNEKFNAFIQDCFSLSKEEVVVKYLDWLLT